MPLSADPRGRSPEWERRWVLLVISELRRAPGELLVSEPLLRPHSQHLLSIVINSGSLKTVMTAPAMRQRFWLNWSAVGGGGTTGICIFKKYPSALTAWEVSVVCQSWGHTVFSFCKWPPFLVCVNIINYNIYINISKAKLRASQTLGYLKTLSWRQAWKIKYTNFVVASKRSQCLSSSKKIIVFVFWHLKPVSSTNHVCFWSKAILGHWLSGTGSASYA